MRDRVQVHVPMLVSSRSHILKLSQTADLVTAFELEDGNGVHGIYGIMAK